MAATRRCASTFGVVAATNRDLNVLMAQEKFRHDLYDRLSVFEIRVSVAHQKNRTLFRWRPTSWRAHCTMNSHDGPLQGCDRCNSANRRSLRDSYLDEKSLLAYHWPGNVRELAHVMREVTAPHPGQVDADHLPERIRKYQSRSTTPAAPATCEVEGMEAAIVARDSVICAT